MRRTPASPGSTTSASRPYEELERAYAEKRDFRCTASFSSLLFHERRALRTGGFFLGTPFPDQVDRVDMLWAVLADVACATYEQLWRLRELCGHDRDYILGFEQATVLGLCRLCSGALGAEAESGPRGGALSYRPGEGELIRRYLPVWNRNRLAVNTMEAKN